MPRITPPTSSASAPQVRDDGACLCVQFEVPPESAAQLIALPASSKVPAGGSVETAVAPLAASAPFDPAAFCVLMEAEAADQYVLAAPTPGQPALN